MTLPKVPDNEKLSRIISIRIIKNTKVIET